MLRSKRLKSEGLFWTVEDYCCWNGYSTIWPIYIYIHIYYYRLYIIIYILYIYIISYIIYPHAVVKCRYWFALSAMVDLLQYFPCAQETPCCLGPNGRRRSFSRIDAVMLSHCCSGLYPGCLWPSQPFLLLCSSCSVQLVVLLTLCLGDVVKQPRFSL